MTDPLQSAGELTRLLDALMSGRLPLIIGAATFWALLNVRHSHLSERAREVSRRAEEIGFTAEGREMPNSMRLARIESLRQQYELFLERYKKIGRSMTWDFAAIMCFILSAVFFCLLPQGGADAPLPAGALYTWLATLSQWGPLVGTCCFIWALVVALLEFRSGTETLEKNRGVFEDAKLQVTQAVNRSGETP